MKDGANMPVAAGFPGGGSELVGGGSELVTGGKIAVGGSELVTGGGGGFGTGGGALDTAEGGGTKAPRPPIIVGACERCGGAGG